MYYRFLVFCIYSLCLSQEVFSQKNINYNSYGDNYFDSYIKINNIGDPILFLIPLEKKSNFKLSHYSQKVRAIDFLKPKIYTSQDSIYSSIVYQSSYNEGGLIETFLSRPISNNVKLNVTYNNLSSLGFYQHQHNKYSLLDFNIQYLDKNKRYNCSFLFSSNNGSYLQNGGVKSYSNNLSLDFLTTYLNAESILRDRFLNFNQQYVISKSFNITHDFIFNSYNNFNCLFAPFCVIYNCVVLCSLINTCS